MTGSDSTPDDVIPTAEDLIRDFEDCLRTIELASAQLSEMVDLFTDEPLLSEIRSRFDRIWNVGGVLQDAAEESRGEPQA